MSDQMYNKFHLLSNLIQGLLSGELDDDKCLQLNQMLSDDPNCLEYYVEYTTVWALLDEMTESQNIEIWSEFDQAILEVLAEEEKYALKIEIPREKPKREPAKKVENKNIEHKFSKFSLVALNTAVAALLFFVVIILLNPNVPDQVATLSDMKGAIWSDSFEKMDIGTRLYTCNPPFSLKKGVVQITYDYGAEVIIEGPAVFTIESDKTLYLSEGRLHSRVLEYGKGFTVKTPSSVLVDIGTEFGVAVNPDGDSQLHVFRGEVVLSSGPKRSRDFQSRRLKAGEAVKVTGDDYNVQTIKLQTNFRAAVHNTAIFYDDFESYRLATLAGQGGWDTNAVYRDSIVVTSPGLIGGQGLSQTEGGDFFECLKREIPVKYAPAAMNSPLYLSALMEWNGTDAGKDMESLILAFDDGDESAGAILNDEQAVKVNAGSAGSVSTVHTGLPEAGVSYKTFDIGPGTDDIVITLQKGSDNTHITGFAFDRDSDRNILETKAYPDDQTTKANWRTNAALEKDGQYGTDGYVLYGYTEDGPSASNWDASLSNPGTLAVLPAYIDDIIPVSGSYRFWGGGISIAHDNGGNYGLMQNPDNPALFHSAGVLLDRTDEIKLSIKRATAEAFRLTLIIAGGDVRNTNKMEAHFGVDYGVVYANKGKDFSDYFTGGGQILPNTRYLCVLKITPDTETNSNISVGCFDVSNGSLADEDFVKYQVSANINPADLTVKGYFLSHISIGIHSNTITADNLTVADNWTDIQKSIYK